MRSVDDYLRLLETPVAQALLKATIPARFAYLAGDGTPRVVPVWFHWSGEVFVLGSRMHSPKVKALQRNPRVALTIDGETWPYKAVQVRGVSEIQVVDGMVPEYADSAHRYYGARTGELWLQRMRSMTSQMARIIVRPDWVRVMDFEEAYPELFRRPSE